MIAFDRQENMFISLRRWLSWLVYCKYTNVFASCQLEQGVYLHASVYVSHRDNFNHCNTFWFIPPRVCVCTWQPFERVSLWVHITNVRRCNFRVTLLRLVQTAYMCIFVHANVFVWLHFCMGTWSDINPPPLSSFASSFLLSPSLYLSWDVLSDRAAVKFVCLSSVFDAVTFDRLKKFRPIKHLQIRSPGTRCYICAASGILFPTHHKAACHPAPTSQTATGSHMVTKMADRDSYRHWLSVCRWVAHCYGYGILESLWLWVTYVLI